MANYNMVCYTLQYKKGFSVKNNLLLGKNIYIFRHSIPGWIADIPKDKTNADAMRNWENKINARIDIATKTPGNMELDDDGFRLINSITDGLAKRGAKPQSIWSQGLRRHDQTAEGVARKLGIGPVKYLDDVERLFLMEEAAGQPFDESTDKLIEHLASDSATSIAVCISRPTISAFIERITGKVIPIEQITYSSLYHIDEKGNLDPINHQLDFVKYLNQLSRD